MSDKNISNKKVKYRTQQLERELQVEPIGGNFSFIDFDNTSTFQPPESTYTRKEQVVFDGDDINKGNDYRRFVVTGETKRLPLNYGDKYIANGHKSSGRGFGNKDVSQQLRYGEDTRQEKKTASSTDLSGYRINDNNFVPNNQTGDQPLNYLGGMITQQGNNLQKNDPSPEIIHLVNGDRTVLPWARGGIDTRNLDKYRKN